MEEILQQVHYEIKNSGLENQMIAGIVLTGGGAQLKHLKQLTEYVTGLPARIGYPNEHLANSTVDDVTSPLYATGVGLVMKGFDHLARRPQEEKVAAPKVKDHSSRTAGNFFTRVLEGAKGILDDDHE